MPVDRRLVRVLVPIAVLAGCVAAAAAAPALVPWIPRNLAKSVQQAASATAWLAAAWLAARLVEAAVTRGGRQVPRLLLELVGGVLFLGALLAIQSLVFEQSVAGLVTTSSVAVAVLGFALRDIIGDVFSGIAINLEQPYRIDDWLELDSDGVAGRVVEINWRATRLVTLDDVMVVVPNSTLANHRFNNYSKPQRRFRTALSVTFDYDVPAERVRQVLEAAVRGAPSILRDPAPEVIAEGFSADGFRVLVRFWVPDYSRLILCRSDVSFSIHRHLRLAGFSPAHTRADLTLRRAAPAPAAAARCGAALREVDLFRCLEEDDLAKLAEGVVARGVLKGVPVVEAGAPGDSLFVVLEGLFEVSRDGAPLATLRPGDVFGEMSLLTGAARSASVSAATEASVLEIGYSQLRPLLLAKPELVDALAQIVAERQAALTAGTAVPDRQTVPGNRNRLIGRIREFFQLLR